MDFVVSWVKQIFILSIISSLIVHLMPSEKYVTYVKILCRIILVVVCITPFLTMLNKNISLKDIYQEIINRQNMDDMHMQLEYKKMLNDTSDSVILKQYKEKIVTDVENKAMENGLYPLKTDIVLDTDENSNTYGQLQQIKLKVSLKKSSKEENTLHDEDAVFNVKKMLSDFYNLNIRNININISEE